MAATVIGAHVRVTGSIETLEEVSGGPEGTHGALDFVISGRVEGSIRARGVIHLKSTAEVRGDLEAARVIIDDGAVFEGQVRLIRAATPARAMPARVEPARVEPSREERPRSEAPRPQPARVVPELSSPGRRRLQRRTP